MADIKIKDVESFGRVLKRLGQFLEENPEQLLALLASSKRERKKERPKSRDAVSAENERHEYESHPELDDLPIFEMAKSKGRQELFAFLCRYDVEQLRYLIRRFRFGALKSKLPQVLAEHIADQAVKRAVDVFTSHETPRE